MLLPLVGSCPLHAATGIPCLSCGATRAAEAFLEGRVVEAAFYNPLLALAVFGFVAGGFLFPVWILAGGRLPVPGRGHGRAARVAAVTALAGNWIYLLARGA